MCENDGWWWLRDDVGESNCGAGWCDVNFSSSSAGMAVVRFLRVWRAGADAVATREDGVSEVASGAARPSPECAAASEGKVGEATAQHGYMYKEMRSDFYTTLSSIAMTLSDEVITEVVDAISSL